MEMRNPKLNGVSVTLPTPAATPDVSGMWMALEGEPASFALSSDGFCGEQSQLLRGKCAIGNRGLNRSGMYFAAGREYRGYLYAKSEGARLVVSLRNADGRILYSSQAVEVSGDWRKYEFHLTAETDEIDGTFAVALDGGECLIGYVFLEHAEWRLYKGMHVRRDVGEGLEHMGLSVLRFGGCMVNSDGYRWKKMLGAPEERAPYRGWWYAYSRVRNMRLMTREFFSAASRKRRYDSGREDFFPRILTKLPFLWYPMKWNPLDSRKEYFYEKNLFSHGAADTVLLPLHDLLFRADRGGRTKPKRGSIR